MQRSAELVIIGAGIVGSSCVYHLAQRGWKNIVVIDQGPLFETGGSTSHAPGLVFQTNSSKTMCSLAQYTTHFYRSLEWEGAPCFYPVGGIEVAYTEARWHDLHRKFGLAQSYGLEGAKLLTPAAVQELVPLINPDVIHGGYYVPTDGIAKAIRAVTALCQHTQSQGAASFYGNTTVTGFEIQGGKIRGVQTDQGSIQTERVLLCAGIWGPKIGKLAGISVPLTPVQHQYVRTTPLPELTADRGTEVIHPILRHQDYSLYYRQHGDCYGIGNYGHEPLLVEPEQILRPGEAKVMPSVMDFTPQHFDQARRATAELLPALASAEYTYQINGMFSFTPDGNPVVGESHVEGFWVAEAVWVTQGGGVGCAVAELMDTGVSRWDLRELDMHRFHSQAHTKPYIRARGAQQYREVYDIIHPKQQMEQPRPLRVTPVHARLVALDAHFFESVGWERPQWLDANQKLLEEYEIPARDPWASRYWSPVEGAEHLAVRNGVALFDISPFTKIRVEGPGALAYLNYIAANQIDVPVGRVVYTAMLNHQGGIMCDLTITRLGEQEFLALTGGGVGMHDLAWMRQNAPKDGAVTITDVTSAYCSLGLWGPQARAVLQAVTGADVSNSAFPYFTGQSIDIGCVPALALRLSYVGELGWEIYAPAEFALSLWDTLWEAGKPHGIIAAGGGAFDTLRLEKGYRLWGNDIHSEYNPYEAGLGWAVRLNKGDFLGKEALQRIKGEGIRRKLCCLTLDDPTAILLGKEPVHRIGASNGAGNGASNGASNSVAGYVTSAGYGYTIGRCIAYSYLPLELSEPGARVTIEYFGRRLPATVQPEPLVDPAMARLKG
jgi:dimethylglycine oxidase